MLTIGLKQEIWGLELIMPLEAAFLSLLYTVGSQRPSAQGYFLLPFLRGPGAHTCSFLRHAGLGALGFLFLFPLQLLLPPPL